MAEGLLKHLAGGAYEVFSAGISPTEVNPLAIQAMRELNIDISDQKSESVEQYLGQEFDHVITVCSNANASCPTFLGGYEKDHWDLDDPAPAQGAVEEKMKVFRRIRDQIKEKVIELVHAESKNQGKNGQP